MASALVISGALLVIGNVASAMLWTDSADAAATAPEVAGAVEIPAPVPDPEIGEASAVRREGPYVPAPTDHLTVVHVSVSACGDRSTGSGFVAADGLILTAAHVVGDAPLVRIDVGGITVTGEVVGVLADGRDVALVSVDAPMATPLDAAAAPPPIGEPITIVGHADGGPRTAVVGARVEPAAVIETILHGDIVGVDATIETGMSGGPAVDAAGDIVGLLVAKEAAADMALVVGLPNLATIGEQGLVPGTCIANA